MTRRGSKVERRIRHAVDAHETSELGFDEDLVRAVLDRVANPSLEDELGTDGTAASYWVLLSSGVNQPQERTVAERLLLWHAFFARHDARVLCLQMSDDAFADCARRFSVTRFPALVISNAPAFEHYVGLGPASLARLTQDPDDLQRFVHDVHMELLLRGSVAELERQFVQNEFKEYFRAGWNELKELVSVRISN